MVHEPVALLRLDVDGHEIAVLQGAQVCAGWHSLLLVVMVVVLLLLPSPPWHCGTVRAQGLEAMIEVCWPAHAGHDPGAAGWGSPDGSSPCTVGKVGRATSSCLSCCGQAAGCSVLIEPTALTPALLRSGPAPLST